MATASFSVQQGNISSDLSVLFSLFHVVQHFQTLPLGSSLRLPPQVCDTAVIPELPCTLFLCGILSFLPVK